MNEKILLLLFFLTFVLVHLAKMTRLYLVLLEQKISFGRFVLIYLKTTFINLLIPFKLGELFRVYCLSKETGNVSIGLLSVLVDRFFDTLALIILLLPLEIFMNGRVSGISIFLLTLVFMLGFVYRMFASTYTYLNKYIIMNKTSRRSMAALRFLETGKTWYDYTRNLIAGRSPLIILFSLSGWILEIGALSLLGDTLGESFGVSNFSEYIAAIFTSLDHRLLTRYTFYGAVIIGVFTAAGYFFNMIQSMQKLQGKRGEHETNTGNL